ncbi:hypothetical protein JCM19239_2213 [Vibrio variabilis]|uniref:Uncharacterized protein n=1 Tax=Vibrio variabilis TaxID=990271 RepID=A0ABQ0JHZ2_9VIBR|nr:hypothetical protein JCM19239_2213 [Vibrio variabilis]
MLTGIKRGAKEFDMVLTDILRPVTTNVAHQLGLGVSLITDEPNQFNGIESGNIAAW